MVWKSIKKTLEGAPCFPGVQSETEERKLDRAQIRVVEAAKKLDEVELKRYLVISKKPRQVKCLHRDELKTIISRMRYLSQETGIQVTEFDLAPFKREQAIDRAKNKVYKVESSQSGTPIARHYYDNLRDFMSTHKLADKDIRANTGKLKKHAYGQ